jgi:hypothetical protein
MTEKKWRALISQNNLIYLVTPVNELLEREIEILSEAYIAQGRAAQEQITETKRRLEKKWKEREKFREEYKYVNGAAIRLVYEGKLKPKFEDDWASKKSVEAMKEVEEAIKRGDKNLNLGRFIRDTCDRRESGLLSRIANEGEPLAITDFGALHAFGGKYSFPSYLSFERDSEEDNIAFWNRLYPNKMFSLIEIIPESYEIGEEK